MISYFRKNKGKTTYCEDSLTAIVFDGFKYLPVELFWKILKGSLYNDKLPHASGEIEEFLFWEKWDAEGTSNSNYVEPDLFIRFHDFDVIIEAKRYDTKQQSQEQLKNEIEAYYNVYAEDEKSLYFIQCGGLQHKEDEIYKEVVICKTDWTALMYSISRIKMQLEEHANTSLDQAISRILSDILIGLELHQFYKIDWLGDFKIENRLKNFDINQLFNF